MASKFYKLKTYIYVKKYLELFKKIAQLKTHISNIKQIN